MATNKNTLCVSIPCYNEEENVIPMAEAVLKIFDKELSKYNCTLQFIDNCSTDKTRKLLLELCEHEPRVRAIFNARNFGAVSGYHGLMSCFEDCAITMSCDFQDPPEMIIRFVEEWEKESKIVCGIANNGGEKRAMWAIRNLYYRLIGKLSQIEQIEHFTGFGLYDKVFLDLCRKLDDPLPSIRGQVAEFGFDISKLEFSKPPRKKGKSKQNFYTLFSLAMRNITSYTQVLPRIATIGGGICGGLSITVGLIYFILKLIYWNMFSAGIAPVLIGVFFMGGLQLFFIGLIGEYVMSINTRVLRKPLVVESKRLNFKDNCVYNSGDHEK